MKAGVNLYVPHIGGVNPESKSYSRNYHIDFFLSPHLMNSNLLLVFDVRMVECSSDFSLADFIQPFTDGFCVGF